MSSLSLKGLFEIKERVFAIDAKYEKEIIKFLEEKGIDYYKSEGTFSMAIAKETGYVCQELGVIDEETMWDIYHKGIKDVEINESLKASAEEVLDMQRE